MVKCAYCGAACTATREHVIPAWYSRTPGEAETFSARAPITHVRGDLVVRDVCAACNSGPLAALDGYGKELFERYFATPAYHGEAVGFAFDGQRLFRWLLKLSYNSARAQDADVDILRGYREVILGGSPILPLKVRCWLHLVAPTRLLPGGGRPAGRSEAGLPGVEEPAWFRIGQFRVPAYPGFGFVQRQVIINSFAFSILAAPLESAAGDEFDRLAEVFEAALYSPVRLIPEGGEVTAAATGDHVAPSINPMLANYPSRFSDQPNPYVVEALNDELKLVTLHVPREVVESGDVAAIADALHDMVSTREKATAFRQRVSLWTDGYDDDPRGLWQIAPARNFFRRLFEACPFVMLLAAPRGGMVQLLAACWLYDDPPPGLAQEQERMGDFLNRAFTGLNAEMHRLAFSDELTRTVSQSAAAVLFEAA